MALTPAQSEAYLRRLLAVPGNDRCVDCPTARPKWASINLGVFMCLRCSGCHRGLGVQISQVRSVTLDTWSKSSLDRLASVGNTRGNAEWMALAPDGLKLPTRQSSMEELKAFIHRKYARKEWHSPAPPPTPKGPRPAGRTALAPAPAPPPMPPPAFDVAFDHQDPFAAATTGGAFDADPFGTQPFDGSGPRAPVAASLDPFGGAAFDGGSAVPAPVAPQAAPGVVADAVAARQQRLGLPGGGSGSRSTSGLDPNPFGTVAALEGIQGGAGGYSSIDPFGERDPAAASGRADDTPTWAVSPPPPPLPGNLPELPSGAGAGSVLRADGILRADAAVAVQFKPGEPLGLGLAARACFQPAASAAITSSSSSSNVEERHLQSTLADETRSSLSELPVGQRLDLSPYSTAVARLNSAVGAAAAAGVDVGWVVTSVNGLDLCGVHHSDVLQQIRGLLLPPALGGTAAAGGAGAAPSFAIVFVRPATAAAEPAAPGKKTALFAPFIYKMHCFTKTGSGQT
jgi:hypothetical protein